MGDPYKKVQPGQSLHIPAAAYNAFVDAARQVQQQQRSSSAEAAAGHRSSGIVLVKNNSGADRERFDVLGVDTPILAPADNLEGFKNTVALSGVVPTAEHVGTFVILLEPLEAGAIGRGAVSGVSIVRIDVQDEADRMADVADGQAGSLKSGTGGVAQILWKEAGTGVKWAVVRIGGGGGGVALGIKQYQVFQMVADNVAGWDWVRAHPM